MEEQSVLVSSPRARKPVSFVNSVEVALSLSVAHGLLLLNDLVDQRANAMRDEDAELVTVLEELARRSGPADAGGSSGETEESASFVS